MIPLSLPWPPSGLRPNRARTQHWAVNGKLSAAYKAGCAIALRGQGLCEIPYTRLHLSLRFHPPTKRHYDLDGSLSAAKAMCDAIADVTGVDDRHFSYTLRHGEPVKGGRVDIVITEE